MTLEKYRELRAAIIDAGYESDITWSESLKPVADADTFWQEYAFVVLNSGMKFTVAEKIWARVRPAVLKGKSAGTVFGHKGKANGIDKVYTERDQWLASYRESVERGQDAALEFLRSMPWIGEVTCYHLAKNYGLDVAKPDRHLVRLSGAEGTHAMCARLAHESGDRVATVDLVIWRAAALGIVESKASQA